MKKLKIRAYLQHDVIADDFFPLDGVLMHVVSRDLGYLDDFTYPHESTIDYDTIELPLQKRAIGDTWQYACSYAQWHPKTRRNKYFYTKRLDHVLFLDYAVESVKTIDTLRGQYKNAMVTEYTFAAPYVEWYCIGDKEALELYLPFLTHIGKKSAQGVGSVLRWEIREVAEYIERAPNDFYPLRPPYWVKKNLQKDNQTEKPTDTEVEIEKPIEVEIEPPIDKTVFVEIEPPKVVLEESQDSETSRSRMLKILNLLIQEPEKYTKKALAAFFKVSEDTIKKDIRTLRQNNFKVEENGYPDYQYYVVMEKVRNDKTLPYQTAQAIALLLNRALTIKELADECKVTVGIATEIIAILEKQKSYSLENKQGEYRLLNTFQAQPIALTELEKVVLLYKAGKSNREIADLINKPINNITALVSYAKANQII